MAENNSLTLIGIIFVYYYADKYVKRINKPKLLYLIPLGVSFFKTVGNFFFRYRVDLLGWSVGTVIANFLMCTAILFVFTAIPVFILNLDKKYNVRFLKNNN